MIAKVSIVALLLLSATAASAPKASAASWIHVEVKEDGADGARVNVDLPLALANLAAGLVGTEHVKGGTIEVGNAKLTVSELRKAWTELKAAGDRDFVTVEDAQATVKVGRRAGQVLVNVQEKHGDTVRVELPSEVVDALLSGQGDELDVAAAVKELTSRGPTDIVRVESDDARVRVWTD